MVIVWTVAVAAFLAVEAATVGLVSIWFAIGSAAALIAAALGAAIWLQIVLFLAVSAVVLAGLRPLARRYLDVRKKPTNADRVIGTIGTVTEDIDNISGTGAANVAGRIWTARSLTGEDIRSGEYVRVSSIQGVKLIVEPVRQPETAVR